MNLNRLKLNSDKTIWLGRRHELLKVSIDSIDMCSCEVKFRDSVNNLGVVIYGQLSMKDHVQKVCKTCYYHLRQLRSIRGSLSADSCSTLVRAFISSRLDYCNSLLTGIDESQVNKLHAVNPSNSGSPRDEKRKVRINLEWHPWQAPLVSHPNEDQKFKIGVLVYRCLRGTALHTYQKCSAQLRTSLADDSSTLLSHVPGQSDSAPECSLFRVPHSGTFWRMNSKIPV